MIIDCDGCKTAHLMINLILTGFFAVVVKQITIVVK